MPDPTPTPLFRVVDAETGEPPESWLGPFALMPDGTVVVPDDYQFEGNPRLRAEFLLDPTTGLPPRRRGV